MPLKKSSGNMYPWVTHVHTHLGGECPHKCSYCYVDSVRFGRPEKYTGPLRLIPEEFGVNYGRGKTIFCEHMTDLWAEAVPVEWTLRVLDHCARYPNNTYVYQTKSPGRYEDVIRYVLPDAILGCTIETNRDIPDTISHAPRPIGRAQHIQHLRSSRRVFITVEPIMDFDVPVLGQWLTEISPEFVNIGADSQGNKLPEPPAAKILALMDVLKAAGIDVRQKANLKRLLEK